MSATAHLAIQNVTRQFMVNSRIITALQDVSLSVAAGEFVTIVGASGCGKSTLLRLGAGLDTGHQGEIRHRGEPVRGASLERGIVFQEPRLFPWLTVERNVALGLENAAVSKADKKRLVDEHLELVGLTGFAKAYPHQLSGGMAQRAGIARGLVNRPDVLFLDEPFGALDAITKAHLQGELQSIWSREKITMILVTHDVDEAVFLGDRVVVMSPRPGRIREIVPVDLPRPRDRTSAAFATVRAHVLQSLNGTTSARDPRPTPADATPVLPRPAPAIAVAR
ncbi:sulfonate transport system ATP-binding protein [Rhizobium sp. RU35A]|uniref:ABC transporter ATP-binding protein n=1 Tax=Rhizobium straminoryzae TaxID=1387186 RepID=A0A549T3J3_9HYPH|nr:MULTISPECIES: ABC transporter ATP-binding protein [Rhizobium]TRL36441.1 ABC transporter ATP-binding protein [Rhizobium straminoryzae]SIQ95740.1 sulfonate transport system ATP-binding protein [Rhizobium sp. RU35A]